MLTMAAKLKDYECEIDTFGPQDLITHVVFTFERREKKYPLHMEFYYALDGPKPRRKAVLVSAASPCCHALPLFDSFGGRLSWLCTSCGEKIEIFPTWRLTLTSEGFSLEDKNLLLRYWAWDERPVLESTFELALFEQEILHAVALYEQNLPPSELLHQGLQKKFLLWPQRTHKQTLKTYLHSLCLESFTQECYCPEAIDGS